MKPVCEIMVQHILPKIRAFIAMELINEYKLSQSEAAQLLGVSQPAISQYTRQLRGNNKMVFSNSTQDEIKKLCQKIYDKKLSYAELNFGFCEICKFVRREKLVCNIHRNVYPLQDCNLCTKL